MSTNQYINWNNFHICPPMRIGKSSNEANVIDANMINVLKDSQPAFTYSKLIMETLKQGVTYVQS